MAVIKVPLEPDWVLRDQSLPDASIPSAAAGELSFALFRAMRRKQEQLSPCRIDGARAEESALEIGMGFSSLGSVWTLPSGIMAGCSSR